MSIIHNALKKLQEEKHKKEQKKYTFVKNSNAFKKMSSLVQEEQQRAIKAHTAEPTHHFITKIHYEKYRHLNIFINFVLFFVITVFIVAGNYYFFQNVFSFLHDINMRKTMVANKKTIPSVPRKVESARIVKRSAVKVVDTSSVKDNFDFLSLSNIFSKKFICTGIIYDDVSPVTIINGAILGIGDTIDGATVIGIYPEEVIIRYKRKKFSLLIS